jgi:hypothetical protein
MQVSDWIKSGADAPCSCDDNGNKRKDRKRRNTAGIFKVLRTVVLATLLSAPELQTSHARDDGRYANSNPELKAWFDGLKSGKGPCCSDADGTALSDVDWESSRGHYRVRLEGEWIDVPDDAVITTPNRIGRTMVWPMYRDGKMTPRCFMPGSMT